MGGFGGQFTSMTVVVLGFDPGFRVQASGPGGEVYTPSA